MQQSKFKNSQRTTVKVKWDFSHTPKQLYSQLQQGKKVFGNFQNSTLFLQKNDLVFEAFYQFKSMM